MSIRTLTNSEEDIPTPDIPPSAGTDSTFKSYGRILLGIGTSYASIGAGVYASLYGGTVIGFSVGTGIISSFEAAKNIVKGEDLGNALLHGMLSGYRSLTEVFVMNGPSLDPTSLLGIQYPASAALELDPRAIILLFGATGAGLLMWKTAPRINSFAKRIGSRIAQTPFPDLLPSFMLK